MMVLVALVRINKEQEPLMPSRRQKYLGLGLGTIEIGDQSTNGISSERVNASECVETIEDSLTETDLHEWEFGYQRSLSDYFLDELFLEPGEPNFEERF